MQATFSMIDRKVVKELVALPETEQFLRGLRAWVGFKQTGVDYVRPERMFGVSTNNWRKNIWWAKKAIFSFSFAPLELMSYAGFVLTGLSILGIFYQIFAKYFHCTRYTTRVLQPLLSSLCLFGGLTLLGNLILWASTSVKSLKRPRNGPNLSALKFKKEKKHSALLKRS
jgi:hypothetical protein